MARFAPALVLFAALSLSACSGNNSLSNAGVGAGSTEGANSAFPGTASATSSDTPFSPFGSIPDPTEGGRQIIANPTVAEVMTTGPLP